MTSNSTRILRLALIQLRVGSSRDDNIRRAASLVRRAATERKAQLICLPECFNSPYGTQHFAANAESIPDGPTSRALSAMALDAQCFLIGGSIPERDNNNGALFNTCTVWNGKGELIGKFRKLHLFDIDVPGKIRFCESEVLTGGQSLCTFRIGDVRIGVGICYDIRFPELARVYAEAGCELLVYPGAFNMTTGPAHWELLQRARAVDNELFVATCSPARVDEGGYVAWGHSMLVSPWGEKVGELGEKEETLVVDADLAQVGKMREQIPVWRQRRLDLYDVAKAKVPVVGK